MPKFITNVDYQKWSKIFFAIAFLLGMHLSRHALDCFITQVDEFELGGKPDDGGSVLDSDGNIKHDNAKGDYSKNFKKGSGFFGYMADSATMCVEQEPFKDPKWAHMGFLGMIVTGLLSLGLSKVFTPEWKKNIAKNAKQSQSDDEDAQALFEMQRSTPKRPEIEAIDVDGIDMDDDFGDGKSSSNSLSLDDPLATSSRKKPRRSLDAPSGLMGSSDEDLDIPMSKPQIQVKKPARARPKPSMSSRKSGMTGDFPALDPPSSGGWRGSGQTDESLAMDLGPVNFPSLDDQGSDGGLSLGDAGPASLMGSEPQSLAGMDGSGLERSRGMSSSSQLDRRTLWIPLGREQDEILYIGTMGRDLEDPFAGESPDEPLISIRAALEKARPWLEEGKQVQLRLLPGLYQESVELPSGVALINHSIPRGMSSEEMRFWLTEERPASHDTRVILALPEHASDEDWTVRVLGERVFLAGLHIVGRGEIQEDDSLSAGLMIKNAPQATVYLCHILGHRTHHSGAGVHVTGSGRNVERRILFQDCLIEDNATSSPGGGAYIEDSAVAFLGCAFQINESGVAGGGLYALTNKIPVYLERCLISENEVQLDEDLPRASRGGWSGEIGHGGGIFVMKGELHLRATDLQDNKAQGAGGGMFAAASVVLMEGDPDGATLKGRVAGNVGLRGAGVLMSGPLADEIGKRACALRAQDIEFLGNEAQESGGALACFRLASIDLKRCVLRQNTVTAEYGEGGGLHANLGSQVKMVDTQIIANIAPFRGGGLSISNSSLRLFDGCEIMANKALQGDCGGVAFYTMDSNYMDDLRESGGLEEPVVFASSVCEITGNQAQRGVGGVFIGNFVRNSTPPITFAIKHPELIFDNQMPDSSGTMKTREEMERAKPTNLLIAWKGVVQGDGHRPPKGKRILG